MAILQARMGSSRLPGKVLELVGGKTVLEHCLERALAIRGLDGVCLATSTHAADDPIAAKAEGISGVEVFRGSELDVLARYACAAEQVRAEVIVRATCDCPLVDPEVCAAVIELRRRTGALYASNNIRQEWPHGLDVEVFLRTALDQAHREAVEPFDREHVGPWIKRHAGAGAVHLPGPGGAAASQRWTLDFPEDLVFLRALWPLLPADRIAGWEEVMAIVSGHPYLTAINAIHSVRH